MALSSYDKIGLAFTKTQDWKRLAEDFRETLSRSGVESFKCKTFQDYESGGYAVRVNLVLGFGNHTKIERDLTQFQSFQFPANSFLSDDELNHIAERLFGTKGHPTYFCKLEKLLKKWPEFARTKLLEENKDAIAEYEARVQEQRLEIIEKPELEIAKKRCYELSVINDIREVVQKFYRKVGPEVLKEALDGVVMHDIMES